MELEDINPIPKRLKAVLFIIMRDSGLDSQLFNWEARMLLTEAREDKNLKVDVCLGEAFKKDKSLWNPWTSSIQAGEFTKESYR